MRWTQSVPGCICSWACWTFRCTSFGNHISMFDQTPIGFYWKRSKSIKFTRNLTRIVSSFGQGAMSSLSKFIVWNWKRNRMISLGCWINVHFYRLSFLIQSGPSKASYLLSCPCLIRHPGSNVVFVAIYSLKLKKKLDDYSRGLNICKVPRFFCRHKPSLCGFVSHWDSHWG